MHVEEIFKERGDTRWSNHLNCTHPPRPRTSAADAAQERRIKARNWKRARLVGNGREGAPPHSGSAKACEMRQPYQAVSDGCGGAFVSDCCNHAILHLDDRGKIRRLAGQGNGLPGDVSAGDGQTSCSASCSLLNSPKGIALSPCGTRLWICDSGGELNAWGKGSNGSSVESWKSFY
uniref:Uncharacterized protein n=1 Tax=Chromera velia CCMP2878 TaxID=1169474 RepID=A0A0G4FC33_9ALVE|eukprot:Cvel_16129.t1-p1 / transcript=Cvel_16129.t1 / gene=Cvel_16129 / organism=Chromera_velia_CCMP2878 / gene_product=hypothetical protein / transcript_product=hypothetical protein / location=Cvel_scaffold1227:31628-32662(-) / protein_length=176 / sequence_SO=supercontig / SO=protein_coding / is_pseudo=false